MTASYASFAEAAAACGASYDDDTLTRFRVARGRGLLQAMRQGPATIPPWHVLLLLAVSQAGPGIGEPVRIVDFGGAVGESALYLQRLCARPFECLVVETPSMASLLAADPAFGHARFAGSLGEEACDVFYSAGALQYLPHPYPVLRMAFGQATQAVVLTRNVFTRGLERYGVQRTMLHDNGAGPIPEGFANQAVAYPHGTIDVEKVLAMAEEAGWRLAFQCPDAAGAAMHPGESFGMDLYFRRADCGPGSN